MKKKILLIEDNKDSLYYMKYLLEKKGFIVYEARTAAKGISIVKDVELDMVLMDIQLPDMSGSEATGKIREFSGAKTLPIVAITAYAMPGDRERILSTGLSGYLSKPIDHETLLAEIEKHL